METVEPNPFARKTAEEIAETNRELDLNVALVSESLRTAKSAVSFEDKKRAWNLANGFYRDVEEMVKRDPAIVRLLVDRVIRAKEGK